MTDSFLGVLALAATTVGALHALAPDHWVPFAALARARRWSVGRSVSAIILCGTGHVAASVALALVGLAVGVEVVERFGQRLQAVAGLLVVAFGLAYALWGLRRVVPARIHGHAHTHYDHVHDPERTTVWALFLIFSADPCVAVIPLVVAAAPLGASGILGVVLIYEAAMIGMMLALVLPARIAVNQVRTGWLDRFGDVAAGLIIASVGILVTRLGL